SSVNFGESFYCEGGEWLDLVYSDVEYNETANFCIKGLAMDSGMNIAPEEDFIAVGSQGGPFTPSEKIYELMNKDAFSIDYEVTCIPDVNWLTFTGGMFGTIPPMADIDLTIEINSNADALAEGVYLATVNFTNLTNHMGDCSRMVVLCVGTAGELLSWDMTTDPGWTTEGLWSFGTPTGQGGEHGYPDPTSGYTGANVYGYNLNGDYENNLSAKHLTSSAINCSLMYGMHLTFQRWLGVEIPDYDHASISVSNDGTNWSTIWENTGEITDDSWTSIDLDISAVADNQPRVYLRWTMGSTDGGWVYCGWNLDDIILTGFLVDDPPCNNDGDVNLDGELTSSDAQLTFQITLGSYTPSFEEECAADCNGDHSVTAGDAQSVFLAVLGSGTCADPM
ncbi:dockerin type I repeat-containing protein, partial [bacterium]|nr:dockerin type I repeat-containing protein [bacterium]